ncbi:MAG: InlB B-repeat-containing protein, partial [Erysipelothrix sp.]
LDSEFKAPVTADTKITADTTIYAKWEAMEYTLTFETNGGSTISSVKLPYEALIGINHSTTKANHVFKGWYLDSEFKAPVTADTKITADITIYAKWSEDKKPIIVDPETKKPILPTTGVSSILLYSYSIVLIGAGLRLISKKKEKYDK